MLVFVILNLIVEMFAGLTEGWEYSTDGQCEKMPSTRKLNVKIRALPCFEQEGLIWIWPGNDPPAARIPSLQPPSGFQIHAEVIFCSTSHYTMHGIFFREIFIISVFHFAHC